MKVKTLGRIVGVTNALGGIVIGGVCAWFLSSMNYDLISLLQSDVSNSYKILSSSFMISTGAYIPLSALMVADGATDVVKGTHHYFSCRVWQKLTGDLETKKKIERDLESYLRGREEEINFFPNI